MYCGPTAIAYVLGPKVHWKDVTHAILGRRERGGRRASFRRFGGCWLSEIQVYLERHQLKLVPILKLDTPTVPVTCPGLSPVAVG